MSGAQKKLRRDGLSTQIDVHDRQQLEIRHSYALGRDRGASRYIVDTFFFVPRNVGVNPQNFTRDRFYADVTALMRIDAMPLGLGDLADPACSASPLHRLAAALDEFRAARRPPRSRALFVHVKLFAHLFAVSVKAELSRFARQARRPDQGDLFARLEAALAKVRAALSRYRSMIAGFDPFFELAHESLRTATCAADEYMSLYLEERLAILTLALERRAHFASGGTVVACRVALAALAREEFEYRRRVGYVSLVRIEDGEYFTYRSSLLKKSVQQALYLDARAVGRDTFVRNAIGAVGAALAAIWALATALPARIADTSGATKMVLAVGGILGYVLKDRIKTLTSEVLLRRVRRFDHSSVLTGEALASVGLGGLDVRMSEAMRFVPESTLSADVRRLRNAAHTVSATSVPAEEIIHYHKVVDVRAREGAEPLPENYFVRDSLRFNVRHFLIRLDEPLDRVAYFDPTRHSFQEAELPKVYHLNVVVRIVREDERGGSTVRLERLRVVLNKEGIVRVEEINTPRRESAPRIHTSVPPGKRAA